MNLINVFHLVNLFDFINIFKALQVLYNRERIIQRFKLISGIKDHSTTISVNLIVGNFLCILFSQ